MYRMFSLMIAVVVAVVGCQTPSEVHMVDKKDADLTVDGWYYATSPTEVSTAQSKLLYEHKLAEALEKVNAADSDADIDKATKKLEAIKSARPVDPPKVAGTIRNGTARDLIAVVFTDPTLGRRLGTVSLPPHSESTFYLSKGEKPHVVFYERGTVVGYYTVQNPADTGWMAWAN